MDIKQSLDACAVVTLGKDMTLRDLAQGCWRMRGLGQGQTVQLLVVNEVLELVREAEEASTPPQVAVATATSSGQSATNKAGTKAVSEVSSENYLNRVVAWLVTNSMRSERLQQLQVCVCVCVCVCDGGKLHTKKQWFWFPLSRTIFR